MLENLIRTIVRPIAPALNDLFGRFVDSREVEKFDPATWEQLRERWPEIRDEFQAFSERNSCPAIADALSGEERIGGANWRVAFLRFFDCEITENQHHFPLTFELLRGRREVLSAFFSVLPPGHRLTPHKGPYKGMLRLHLGLDVPPGDCGLSVLGETHRWKNGEWLYFDDTALHEAWNETDEPRLILLMDIRRKLKGPAKWFDSLLVYLLSRIAFPLLGTYRKMVIPAP